MKSSQLLLCAAYIMGSAGCGSRESAQSQRKMESPPAVIQPMPVQPVSAAAPELASASSAPLSAAETPRVHVDEPAGSPLPETAYRCTLTAASIPTKLKTGGRVFVQVTVTNDSTSTWPKSIPGQKPNLTVAIGYHWNDGKAKGLGLEGSLRGYLPENLAPGMSAKLELPVLAPAPGSYTLRIEPVHESVTWFSAKNGCFKTVKVTVVP